MKSKQIQLLVELSESYEEANDIIERYCGLKFLKEKLQYLKTTWPDVQIFSRTDDNLEIDYISLLTTIVNLKYH